LADLNTTLSTLDAQWLRLAARWESTRTIWQDQVQGDFARDHWLPLAGDLPALRRELEHLAGVLAQARRAVK
jgi:hypothetical protein